MRCYAISFEVGRSKRANALADEIRRMSCEWERPHDSLWIVKTPLSAKEIRSELLQHLDFQDRLYICEAGRDRAKFNAISVTGAKVAEIEGAREKSRLLENIFSRNGRASRHLRPVLSGRFFGSIKVANSGNLKSA